MVATRCSGHYDVVPPWHHGGAMPYHQQQQWQSRETSQDIAAHCADF